MDLQSIVPGVVCTAGHVDHGKSALVRRLTGIDPDRLPEEKERGMTTDIGFASFLLPDGRRLGLIDVPGHERFVRHMVAGATGIRGALLVVAADSGVMPQTREHLRILEILGVSEGLVALTKADLADDEMIGLVQEDVQSLVKGTFLEKAPVIAVSALNGFGIPEIEKALQAIASGFVPGDGTEKVFRLPVQRAFTIDGHGTVVTGVPFGGHVERGEGVEALDSGSRARVRKIMAYGEEIPRVSGPHSVALNLSGIDWNSVKRGDTISTPGCIRESSFVEARLHLSPEAAFPLADRVEVDFFHGTRREPATLVLLDRDRLEPGDDAIVQLRLERPGFFLPKDRYLIRRPSPAATLGGGVILSCSRRKRRRSPGEPWKCADLVAREAAAGDVDAFLVQVAVERGVSGMTPSDAAAETGLPHGGVEARLERLAASGAIRRLPGHPRFIAPDALEKLRRSLLNRLMRHFEENPGSDGADRKMTCSGSDAPPEVADAVLSLMAAEGSIETRSHKILLPGSRRPGNQDDPDETRVEAMIRDWGLQPVQAKTVVSSLMLKEESVLAIFGRLLRSERIFPIGDRGVVHAECLARARAALLDHFEKDPGGMIGCSKAKGLFGVSNRVADLLLGHFQGRENLLVGANGLFRLKPDRNAGKKGGERAGRQGAKQE